MKKIYIAIITGVLVFSGCKKEWLDMKQPGLGLTSEEYFSDPDHAYELVVSAYDMLEGGGNEWGQNDIYEWVIGSVFSDDAEKGGESAGDQQEFLDGANFRLTPGSEMSKQLWEQLGKAMYRATLAIDKIENLEGLDEASRKEYIAEMRFVRCFSMFRLIRCFGDIPLYRNIDDYSQLQPRAPKAEVYAFMEDDLSLAAADLPITRKGTSTQGRAIKGAAQGYLAMTYLYQQKWSEAQATCSEIINSGNYALVDLNKIFTSDEQWGSEVIWATSVDDIVGADAGSNEGGYLSVWYSPRNGQQGHDGWGFHLPTQNFVDAFETGDDRRDAWVVDNGEIIDGVGIPYELPGPEYEATGYMCQKYVLPSSEFPSVVNGQALDQIHMRYADVLLMHAEASMELGDNSSALQSLAQVRQRAGLGSYPDQETIAGFKETSLLGHEELRAVIYHERRIELGLENSRFFDLVRWGDAKTVLDDYGITTFVEGCSELLPIPAKDIDVTDGKITQNPCY